MELDVDSMLDGFDAREEQIMSGLRELKAEQQIMAASQREMLATAHAMFQALDPENDERTRAPNMFTIVPERGKLLTGATHESVRVTCWCEHPDGPHPAAPIGSNTPPDYLIKMPKEWLVRAAPYITTAAVLFKAFVPLVGTVVGQGLDIAKTSDLAKHIAIMNDVAKAIPSGELKAGERDDLEAMHRHNPEVVALKHLHDFLLKAVKQEKQWGELRPVRTKTGQILWLCAAHAAIQQPPVLKI